MDTHIPVLAEEVIQSFAGLKSKNNLSYFDGTFGRGGHYTLVKQQYNIVTAVATDQDLRAIEHCHKNYPEVNIHHLNFLQFAEQQAQQGYPEKFDMILCDLGVSSPQLDEADRGFSFNKDGPLDMRMNQKQDLSAATLINEKSEEELNSIFKIYGEVPSPFRVVRAIINDRQEKPFTSTLQLAQLIERVDGWRKKGFHPATQYFMALRLVVNQELEVVSLSIPHLVKLLSDGGILSVITFHSLEDRIVKNLFKENAEGFPLFKKVIVPSEEECKINPRARSAKLRVFQKGLPPEKPDKFALRRMQRETQSDDE